MFSLIIATVDKQLFSGDVYSATCPGSDGELTILAHHMPFITTLTKGNVCVHVSKDGNEKTFEINRGLLEVGNNKATILV